MEICDCEFERDPDDPDEDEEPWHFKRTCLNCGKLWWALHCRHDMFQDPCPRCGMKPEPVPETE